MRALTVLPGHADSLEVRDWPDPEPDDGDLLVDGLHMGICGTDKEIAAGDYGQASPGSDRLVIGHESLGRVRTAPDGSGFSAGDLVVGVVRRPDPVPCGACAHGQFDMCRNGRYTERGIKGHDGYGSTAWTVDPDYAVRLDPSLTDVGVLMEPTTIVTKAWEQIRRVGDRSWFEPRTALVTGAGPVGLLAALLGVRMGLDVHVLDQVTDGPKPDLVSDLGATYHHSSVDEVASAHDLDVVVEATGVGPLVFDSMVATGSYGIVCLTGVSPTGRPLQAEAGTINREIVLENDVVIGSVNANLEHYRTAAHVLDDSDRSWLQRLISRHVPLEQATEAFQHQDGDVKVVIDLAEDADQG